VGRCFEQKHENPKKACIDSETFTKCLLKCIYHASDHA